MIDTVVQVAATSGVRFALIFSLFLISPFVTKSEVGGYDLFIVSSSMILIMLTIGLDSGLVIVTRTHDERRQAQYLWTAIAIVFTLSLLLYWPLSTAVRHIPWGGAFGGTRFSQAYIYAFLNGVMLLVFSFFRWRGEAFAASVIIVAANILGFVAGFTAFFMTRTVDSFITGLVVGNAVGTVASLGLIYRALPSPALARIGRVQRLTTIRLLRMSLPFALASTALIARRAVDRAVILTIGSATLLGSYALVSRGGELVAFFFALPAIGFAPLIIRNHASETGRRLARLLYSSFLVLAALVILIAAAILHWYGAVLFSPTVAPVAPLLVVLIVANLFLTESTVAGFGFVIAKQTAAIAWLSVMFITINLAVTIPLAYAGYGIWGVGLGYLFASFAHASLLIWLSERLFRFGYPLRLALMFRVAVTILAVITSLPAMIPSATPMMREP